MRHLEVAKSEVILSSSEQQLYLWVNDNVFLVQFLTENMNRFEWMIRMPFQCYMSLFTFKRRLKMHLFRLSYPDLTL